MNIQSLYDQTLPLIRATIGANPYHIPSQDRDILARYPGKGAVLGNHEGIGQYWTPPFVADHLWRFALVKPGQQRVLDPAGGTGNLLAPVIEATPLAISQNQGRSLFTLVEVDPDAARVAEVRWPFLINKSAPGQAFREAAGGIIVANAGDVLFGEGGYDAALLNPPFGLYMRGQYVSDLETTSEDGNTLSQVYIIEKAVRAVRQLGFLAVIVPTQFFGSQKPAERRLRDWLSRNTHFLARIDLPEATFRDSGTTWPTSIMLLQVDSEATGEFTPAFQGQVLTVPWSKPRLAPQPAPDKFLTLPDALEAWLAHPAKQQALLRRVERRKRDNDRYWSIPAPERRHWFAHLPGLPGETAAPAVHSKESAARAALRDLVDCGLWPGASTDTTATDNTVYVRRWSGRRVKIETRSAVASLLIAPLARQYMGVGKDAEKSGASLLTIHSLSQNGPLAVLKFEHEARRLGLVVEWEPSLINHIVNLRHWLERRYTPVEKPTPDGVMGWSVLPAVARPGCLERITPKLQGEYRQADREIRAAIARLQAKGMWYETWDYQIHGAASALMKLGHRGGFLLGDEPGVGKTLQSFFVAEAMLHRSTKGQREKDRRKASFERGRQPRVLIVTMARLIHEWLEGAIKVGYSTPLTAVYHGLRQSVAESQGAVGHSENAEVAVIMGRTVCATCGKEVSKAAGEIVAPHRHTATGVTCPGGQAVPDYLSPRARQARIHLASYEALSTRYPDLSRQLRGQYGHDYVLGILDEATKVKNPESKTSLAIRKGLRSVPRWLLITATADENGLQDLPAQMRFIFQGISGEKASFDAPKAWVEAHFEHKVTRNGAWVLQPGQIYLDDVVQYLKAASIRRRLLDAEVQENAPAPDPVYQVVELKQSPAERKAYQVLHDKWRGDALLEELSRFASMKRRRLDGYYFDPVTAQPENVSGEQGWLNSLRQSASALWLWPEQLWPHGYETTKVQWTRAKVAEYIAQGRKGVVCTSHLGALAGFTTALRREFGDDAVEFIKGGDLKRTRKVVERFNDDPTLMVLVCSTLAVQYGINGLLTAKYLILADRPWMPGQEEQLFGRLLRKGRDLNDPPEYWLLTLVGTADEYMDQKLFMKRVQQRETQDGAVFDRLVQIWRPVLEGRDLKDNDGIGKSLGFRPSLEYHLSAFLDKVGSRTGADRLVKEIQAMEKKMAALARDDYAGRHRLDREYKALLDQVEAQAAEALRQRDGEVSLINEAAAAEYRNLRRR